MRDDNTTPRDNQQIDDDNQQSGVANPKETEEGIANQEPNEDRAARTRVPPRQEGVEGPLD